MKSITLPFLILAGLLIIGFLAMLMIESTKRNREFIRNANINKIDSMSGVDFERFLQLYYERLGYSVETTPKSGDFGADLILIKGRKKTALQAKRYKGTVGIAAVQQIIGAKDFYKTADAMVVTNSHFTVNAKKLASASGVMLVERDDLIKMLDREKEVIAGYQPSTPTDTCPDCGGKLKIKHGKYGRFVGCENYPKCKYSRNVE